MHNSPDAVLSGWLPDHANMYVQLSSGIIIWDWQRVLKENG